MAGGTPSGAGGSVAGRTNEPSRVLVTWTALLDAIALPLWTAQEQLAHGDFSCCESGCEDCEAHSLQQASEMASPMMSPANAQKAREPITANRRLEARNRIEHLLVDFTPRCQPTGSTQIETKRPRLATTGHCRLNGLRMRL